ncbi:MAG: methyltransferase domain-containing protein [Oscillospiraceae bacterium]|nr:methyltransferase domain-containing protein [Oscillospiraceae bacterium]
MVAVVIAPAFSALKNMSSYNHFARFYDLLQKESENPVDYIALAEYIDRLFGKKGEGILLDLACGTGELSIALSRYGYSLIGVDSSEDMLSVAFNKDSGAPIQYVCQDMRELDLYGTIDYCVCALDGINHLTEKADVQKVFDRVSLFMNKGGLFFFDVNTINKHKNILSNNTFIYDLPSVYCVWQNYYVGDGLTEIRLNLFEKMGKTNDYKRHDESFSQRAYSLSEIEQMAERAGFRIVSCYEWLGELPANEKSEKVVFLAVKN